MTNKSCLTRAYKQHWLWPQIHSAVDVFIKRRAAEADSYELTWRLIHIWECVIVTLAQASIARLLDMPEQHEADIRAIREKAYGRTWNEVDATINVRGGALDGSIDRWIEILEYISTIESIKSDYLRTIANFLNSKTTTDSNDPIRETGVKDQAPIDFSPLRLAWSRACDVTKGTPNGEANVKSALKAVNSFRNRFAHVPFPYDPVQSIYKALEQCTEEMFAAPNAADTTKGALSGAIAYRQSVIQGSNTLENTVTQRDSEPTFVHGLKGNAADEYWPAKGFIYIDQMLRPYVLTRLRDEEGLWEYTRYLAESNAVITVTDATFFLDFPIPEEADYVKTTEDEDDGSILDSDSGNSVAEADTSGQEASRSISDMGEANLAIRSRNFEPAIEYLEQRVADRPHYHVGWLKLGQARRELAVDLWQDAAEKSSELRDRVQELLKASLKAFDRASNHIERRYEAEAFYNMSKSYFRLWQIDHSWEPLEKAIESAEHASRSYPEAKYESWIEYLDGVRI